MIVAISAVRTPMGKFGGTLKDFFAYELGGIVLKEACKRAKIPPHQIDECFLGCCFLAGNGINPARTASRLAGFPASVSATTIAMACASGMKAVIMGIQSILSGDAEIAAAGGMESVSNIPYLFVDSRWKQLKQGNKILLDGWCDARDPFLKNPRVGNTAENLISKYKISRKQQDIFALESLQKALSAQKKGLFKPEIVPIPLKHTSQNQIFAEDETIRENPSLKELEKLNPVFKEKGTLTAGNSSQSADGASAVLLTTEKKAKKTGTKPLFKICSYAVGAVENKWAEEAPSRVLPMALKKSGMTLKDLDYLEINEAFAGMILANLKILNYDTKKLNVNGGSIALGHPLGSSGSRILVTLYHVLKERGGEIGGAVIGGVGGVAASIIIQRYE